MAILELTLPKPGVPVDGTLETDAKNLGSWLDNLPYLAVVESVREINDRLYTLNRNGLPANQRLQLMEQYHVAYRRLHESLIDAQLARTGRPEPHEAIQAGRTLCEEMAFGYKLAVSDSVTSQGSVSKQQDIALAIERAIHYLSIYLIQHYQTYDMIEGSILPEIVALYRHAEREALLQEKVPIASTESTLTAVGSTFKQIAFLSAMDPYRLSPRTVWDVFNYLGLHKEKIQFQDPGDGTDKTGILILDLDRDNTQSSNSGDPRQYWLNGRALIEALHRDLEKLQAGESPLEIGFSDRITRSETIQLGARLLKLWARAPQRVMPRFSGSGTTTLLNIGLSAIHAWLTEDRSGSTANANHIHCLLLNRSKGGLALQCVKVDGAKLSVGQITAVGMPASAGKLRWIPAVVRWLVKTHSDGIRFGIQYIGDH
ncbi:MAG: hypothetical protein V3S33_06315, partial [Gammaproteobacteria bacterium]